MAARGGGETDALSSPTDGRTDMSLRRDTQPEDAHAGSAEAEEGGGAKTAQLESGEEEEMVKSAAMEASTLQWPGDRQAGGQTGKGDRASVRSDGSLREAASWTESERELMAERERKGGGGASEEEGPGLRTHLEKELEELEENQLPEKAAQVFSPAVTVLPSPSSPRESEAFWELESERGPFLTSGAPQDYNQHGYQYEWATERPPASSKYSFFFCVPLSGGRSSDRSVCVRWARLSWQGGPKDRGVSGDISTLLPLPGVGGLCLPAI